MSHLALSALLKIAVSLVGAGGLLTVANAVANPVANSVAGSVAGSVASSVASSVERYHSLDISLSSTRVFTNPWSDLQLSATLTSPSGRMLSAAGFYDGSGRWIIRVAFDELGVWSVTTRSTPSYAEFTTVRQIDVTPGSRNGPLRLDSQSRFVHADASPFFLVGDTCYPLLGLDRQSQLLPYLKLRSEQGFTMIRFQVPMIEPRFPLWPWGGTREQPDLDRFNPEYFQELDRRIGDLARLGLQAELILLNFYPTGGPMRDPKQWTTEREKAWLSYVVSRYAAFDNIAFWTLANEFETRPDGVYRLDEADIEWARRTAAMVKSLDPYRHPVTVHPYSDYQAYLRAFASAPELDLLALQEHGAEVKVARHLSDGDGSGLEDKIRQAAASGKAVVDSEFGYEWDGSTTRGSNTSSDLLRRQAWRIVMGGGHFSAGFRGTVFNFAEITFDPGNGRRPGGQYISTLARFFEQQTRYWLLEPDPQRVSKPNLCLRGDQEFIVYAPAGGNLQLDLTDRSEPFAVTWLNPVTGESRFSSDVDGGAVRSFSAPWNEAVLHLTAAITVEAPVDGGWPRNPAKIQRLAPNHFTVDPDGHDRYVTVDVVNHTTSIHPVVLAGFLTQFGRVRNTRQYSPDQYLYVQKLNGAWQRIYRTGPELRIDVPPGRTRISTVVPFSYQDDIDYLNSIHDPRVQKDVVLSSGDKRYLVYRLRITNPGSRKKLRIAFTRTNHAYERSGFFMAQGVIEWLLSGDPAANLDHLEWTIYPCLDPQAIHDGQDYTEYDNLVLDNGRKQRDALWNPQTGELPAARYHVLTDLHMWESRDWESYKYNDPFAPSGKNGNGHSEIESVMLAFWPYWYEFGIDAYDHENKWETQNAMAENFGGALVTHLEIPFYGKDDIDPRERLREQGRMWARSHSQAFLRFQRNHNFWTTASPAGPVDTTGALLLPIPEVLLLENLAPRSGNATPRANADHGLMSLYHETYEHGIGMRSGGTSVYDVPAGVDTFRAMAGVDDAASTLSAVTFIVERDGQEIWRSRPLRRSEREMAFVDLRGARRLTLRIEGEPGLPGNWGGAKFTRHDPEMPFAAR